MGVVLPREQKRQWFISQGIVGKHAIYNQAFSFTKSICDAYKFNFLMVS